MDAVYNYLDAIFLPLPKTEALENFRTDLEANMEDRFAELIQSGESKETAVGIIFSELGNINEVLQEMGVEAEHSAKSASHLPIVDVATVDEFIAKRKKAGLEIALGVFLCIISVIGAMISDLLGNAYPIIEGLGFIFLFLTVAVGVMLFIVAGIQLSHYKYLKNKFVLTNSAKEFTLADQQENHRFFALAIGVGVALCIISLIPPALSDLLFIGAFFEAVSMISFMCLVASGVFLFVYAGIIKSSYTVLLKGL